MELPDSPRRSFPTPAGVIGLGRGSSTRSSRSTPGRSDRADERAAVEAALSSADVQAGFRDGGRDDGLVPPRLEVIQRRLRQGRDTDRLTARLERYVSGSGSWLFQADSGARTPDEGSLAYVLAGLPEEEHTPAMFLVLVASGATSPTLSSRRLSWWMS